MPTRGSRGTDPRKGIPIFLAKRRPPPVVGRKTCEVVWQLPQTYPDIFSTSPRILMPAFLQKSISFLTSSNDTSCGVVTTTAPSTPDSLSNELTDRFSASTPIIFGIEGPLISVSQTYTVDSGFDAKAWASNVEKVDLPTPPLPDRTRILLGYLDRALLVQRHRWTDWGIRRRHHLGLLVLIRGRDSALHGGSGATRLGVFVGAAKSAAVVSVRAGAIFFTCLSSKLNTVAL
ncbi:hypothetical protein TMatcc_007515 [Talaromyces marneffei ATCC 18224]